MKLPARISEKEYRELRAQFDKDFNSSVDFFCHVLRSHCADMGFEIVDSHYVITDADGNQVRIPIEKHYVDEEKLLSLYKQWQSNDSLNGLEVTNFAIDLMNLHGISNSKKSGYHIVLNGNKAIKVC